MNTKNSKTDSEVQRETLQRVIRTETRLVTLATRLGVDIKDDEDIQVDAETRTVILTTLDVPYTSVIKAARRAGLHGQQVKVVLNGERIADMPV